MLEWLRDQLDECDGDTGDDGGDGNDDGDDGDDEEDQNDCILRAYERKMEKYRACEKLPTDEE